MPAILRATLGCPWLVSVVLTTTADKGFVDRSIEPRGAALVEAILGIATALDLGTIAEGIETSDQLDLVRRLGCRTGQGYLFARPAPPDLMAHTLTSSWAGALT